MRNFSVRMAVVALVALSWLGIPSTSTAEKPGKGKKGMGAAFKKLDANGDGKITQEEMQQARQQRAAAKGKTPKQGKGRTFKKADTNNDGALTPDEFRKIAELKKAKRKQQ